MERLDAACGPIVPFFRHVKSPLGVSDDSPNGCFTSFHDYGRALFFLRTNDFSLQRLAAVLMLLNMLSFILAFTMRTDYDFYYFPALSGFWFLVVYLSMRFCAWLKLRGLQIGISKVLVKLAIQHPGFLEKVVVLLESTCRMHINVHELRFRLSLDMFIVYAGMLFAIGHMEFTHASQLFPLWFGKQIRLKSRFMQSITVLAAPATIALSITFAIQFSDIYAYNNWYAVISLFPVLAFVALRNTNISNLSLFA
jgi:hypothetical protein